MRLIDADAFFNDFSEIRDYEWASQEYEVDAEPVRHGRWIIDRAFGNDVLSGEQMVICSVCHKGIFWGKQNYCPNCGAKMDGKEQNDGTAGV